MKEDSLPEMLKKISDFLLSHIKLIFGFVAILLLTGSGYAIWSVYVEKTEKKLQALYYPIEKKYLDRKNKFDQAERVFEQDFKKYKESKKIPSKDIVFVNNEKKKFLTTNASKYNNMPTEDYTVDYGDIVKELEALIQKYPKAMVSQMAAILLNSIYLDHKVPDNALAVAYQALVNSHPFTKGLILLQQGSAFAAKNQYDKAIQSWQDIIDDPQMAYLHAEANFRKALSYEALDKKEEALAMYETLANSSPKNSLISSESEKLARYLKVQKHLTQ